jgi:tRNA pseudouridine55 synthase
MSTLRKKAIMDAVINFKKPKHISSQNAVTKVKHLFGVRKAGHAGTLDPMATGVLIICLNEATKITRFLSDLDKEYLVRLKLGETTDTYDATGSIIEKRPCPSFKEGDLSGVLEQFVGQIEQLPPMYSAIKKNGQPLYKLARMGMTVKRPVRTVTIHAIELIHVDPPYVDLNVQCSKGTYIRTLCDDIGKALGVGAHMVSLERTRIGSFRIDHAVSLEELPSYTKRAYFSIDSALSHLNEIHLDNDTYRKARNGIPVNVHCETPYKNQYVRLKNPEKILFGIGKFEGKTVKMVRMLHPSV